MTTTADQRPVNTGHANIAGQGFHTNPERINMQGRKPGKNRATVLRELYEMTIKGQTLEGLETNLTVEQSIIQALILKAQAGDVNAIKEAQDTVYGKLTDKVEQETKIKVVDDVTQKVLSKLSDEELESLTNND